MVAIRSDSLMPSLAAETVRGEETSRPAHLGASRRMDWHLLKTRPGRDDWASEPDSRQPTSVYLNLWPMRVSAGWVAGVLGHQIEGGQLEYAARAPSKLVSLSIQIDV